MISDIRNHINHYIVLGVWLSIGLLLFIMAGEMSSIQQLVVVLMAAGYGLWGILHHYILHDLTGKIAVEYLLVATIASLTILGMLEFR